MAVNQINAKKNFVLLIILLISSCLQFDYLFFNISFVLPFVAVLLSFFYVVAYNKISIFPLCGLIGFFATLLIYLVAFDRQANEDSIRRAIVYYGYVALSIFVIRELLKKTSSKEVRIALKCVILFGTLAVAIETFFRFAMPTLDLRGGNEDQLSVSLNNDLSLSDFILDQYFYLYKYSSIMFFDSNFVAIFLLPVLVMNLFYINKFESTLVIYGALILNISLMLLTLSRSGILVALTVLSIIFLRFCYKRFKAIFLLFLPLFLLLVSFLAYQFSGVALSDGSLISKFYIFKSLNSMFQYNILNILFGFGVVDGGYVYSYEVGAYAHALIPLILGQFGLIGLFIYLLILFRLSFISGLYGWLLFFAIFFAGFSLADPMQIMIYLGFMLMARSIYIDRNQKFRK